MIYYINAIQSLVPNAQCVVSNNGYENIIWHDDRPLPAKELVDAEFARLQAEYETKEYQRQRVAEYPTIGDQLDALWKGGDAAAEMLAKVQAVKNKYPKGTE
jgi:hypothetical protein